MTEKEIFYNSISEKDTILTRERDNGFVQLHDDFVDSNGNATDGTSGRLILTNKVTKIKKTKKNLDEALIELLSAKGVDSDDEIAKLKKILDRETLTQRRSSSSNSTVKKQDNNSIGSMFKKIFKRGN